MNRKALRFGEVAALTLSSSIRPTRPMARLRFVTNAERSAPPESSTRHPAFRVVACLVISGHGYGAGVAHAPFARGQQPAWSMQAKPRIEANSSAMFLLPGMRRG